MEIIKCIHYDSACYKQANPINPVGIVVHSTGVNATYLRRFVQPSESDPNYNKIIKKLGKNKNGNSWNRNVDKSTHYMVGKFADDTIGVVQMLPEDIACWGVGRGSKGSYNYEPTAHIQFEVCEDDLKNEQYYKQCYNMAVSLCADICRRYGWESDVIVSHHECYKAGYGSNHADIDHWLKKYKMTMTDFRNDVHELLHGADKQEAKEGDIVNFVGKTHYSNANSASPKTCKSGEASITRIMPNTKHPYCLVRTAGSKSNVYGWVNRSDFELKSEIKVGDKVKIKNGATWTNGKKPSKWVYSTKLYVRQIEYKNGKKVYLISTQNLLPVYTGRVYAENCTKV